MFGQENPNIYINSLNRILRFFLTKKTRYDYIQSVLKELIKITKFQCAGIRILGEEGQIPYESYIGFSRDFWEKENCLSIVSDNCLCVRVLTGNHKAHDLPMLTLNGSFCCNNASNFVSSLAEADLQNFRGTCIKYGYQSIALVPIFGDNRILGLIHTADERPGLLSDDIIEYLESIASTIGKIIYRFNLEDRLRKKQLLLKNNVKKLKLEIQERLKVEKQLLQSNERFKIFMNNTPAVVFIIDHDYRIVYVNRRCEKYFQLSHEDICGKTIFELLPLANADKIRKSIDSVLKNGTTIDVLHLMERPDGTERDWLFILFPFKGDNDRVLIGGISADITDINKIRHEMLQLDRLKLFGQMAAGLGHEIRNPLTSARGFLQIIRSKKEYEKDLDYFDLIIDELDRVNIIITEFLSLAKSSSKEMRKHNLNHIINNIAPLLFADARNFNVDILTELGEIPEILVDHREIKQLIINLVRNGLEAMDSGKLLEIKTYLDGEEVVLLIKDQGHGIKKDILANLGTPFLTTKSDGTGLGLAICYSIAHRHNATISVETSNKGTAFYVRFKCPQETRALKNIN